MHVPAPQVATADIVGAGDTVVLNQPFTWNPAGPGVKIEDTVQLTESGIKVLTVDDRWPAATVNGLKRPGHAAAISETLSHVLQQNAERSLSCSRSPGNN
ncbi:hypothetical protein [Pseudarthrobacter humi]|uniref:hypothetical protein n=1 Tax=Pseudarthrobacter humi TaxID=2952523 RepID=UPI003557821E